MVSKLLLTQSILARILRRSYYALSVVALAVAKKSPEIPLKSVLRINDSDFPLASILDRAAADSAPFGEAATMPMRYGIFKGRSSLRSLSDTHIQNLFRLLECDSKKVRDPLALQRAIAILFLLRGDLETSHEIVLGITPAEIENGEYAATHRGETTWADDHPFTTESDIIHAAIHRLEGPVIGEGNYTGYENAKYWAMGGPKKLEREVPHPVRELLADRAKQYAPKCLARNIVAGTDDNIHCIIAGGGESRDIRSPSSGKWDSIAFIDTCELRAKGRLSAEECEEVADLQRAELLYLLRHELIKAGFGLDENSV